MMARQVKKVSNIYSWRKGLHNFVAISCWHIPKGNADLGHFKRQWLRNNVRVEPDTLKQTLVVKNARNTVGTTWNFCQVLFVHMSKCKYISTTPHHKDWAVETT